jgi:hypothetical protein
MMVVPGSMAVTTPVLLILAVAGALELHTPAPLDAVRL